VSLLRQLTQRRTIADRYLERGLYHLDKKKYDKGIADLTEAIASEDRNAELYTTRGFIYLQGYLQADEADYLGYARADFAYALALDARQWVASYCLGMIAYAEEDYREALEHFTAAYEVAPLRPEIYYYRALCHFQLGDRSNAIKEMEFAIQLFGPEDRSHRDAVRWIKVFEKNTP
jgi:tetratricopeptide (TPR) repeat protein